MTHEVLDRAPVAEKARAIAGKIDDPVVAARFAKVAFEQLLADPRNVRAAEEADLIGAAAWARRKFKRGVPLYVFSPCQSSLARLRRVARQLQQTCDEALYLGTLGKPSGRERMMRDLMCEFISKIVKPDFATLDVKSRLFARERKARIDLLRAAEPVCEDEEIYAAPGLVWRRLISVAQMWAVGAEFHNCMARGSANSAAYARHLRSGIGHFFVLRDHTGKGVMVALGYPNLTKLEDVRGPGNVQIDPDSPALVVLAEARGWRTHAPRRAPPMAAVHSPVVDTILRTHLMWDTLFVDRTLRRPN
jgi:hypothetical protein